MFTPRLEASKMPSNKKVTRQPNTSVKGVMSVPGVVSFRLLKKGALPETIALENRPSQKETRKSSNHSFSGAFAVSFREATYFFF